ncbi:hypothetical protein SB758_32925, partial [Burkholderia sp. SIMBA_013]
ADVRVERLRDAHAPAAARMAGRAVWCIRSGQRGNAMHRLAAQAAQRAQRMHGGAMVRWNCRRAGHRWQELQSGRFLSGRA